jgi:Cu/Ag efflux protein CusF
MRKNRLLFATVLMSASLATTGLAAGSVSPYRPASAAHGAAPFSLTGTITKISTSKNDVTVLVKKQHYVLLTSTSTVFTVKSKPSSLKKLKVGETIHATGEKLASIYLTLTVKG